MQHLSNISMYPRTRVVESRPLPATAPMVPPPPAEPEVAACPTCHLPFSENRHGWTKNYTEHSDHTGHLRKFGYCLEPCPTCSGDVEKRMAAKKQAERVNLLFGTPQIPAYAKSWTLESSPANQKAKDMVSEYIRQALADMETIKRGLWMGGPAGSGKTGLAIGAMKEAMKSDRQTLFVQTIELLNKLRASFGKESEITEDALLNAVCTTDLVVLDDVATERPSPYVLEQFYYIVEKRRSLGKWTIFTSNLSTNDLENYWRPDGVKPGSFHPGLRIVERLREYCQGCTVAGANHRAG